MIEAILKKDIPGLGKSGQIIKVKDGYLRNYLLPNNLAVEASVKNLKIIEEQKQKEQILKEKEKKAALDLAEKLRGFSFNVKKDASEKDVLYGSVTRDDIQKVLRDEGYDMTEEAILLSEPIKNLGIYEIQLQLHPDVLTKVKIWVVRE